MRVGAATDWNIERTAAGRVDRVRCRAGSDDISRIDSAFTWRIQGSHAIGVNYLWSNRSAQYPVAGSRRHTLGTVGVYYTVLSHQGFGAVDWRAPAASN